LKKLNAAQAEVKQTQQASKHSFCCDDSQYIKQELVFSPLLRWVCKVERTQQQAQHDDKHGFI
jgi:hypothetical protein